MTSLTLITVAVVLVGMLGPRGYGVALALAGATSTGAALVLGSVAVPTFYAVSVGCVVALVLGVVATGRAGVPGGSGPLPPGVTLLLLFFAWSVLITLVAPLVFDGLPVLVPSGEGATLQAGVVTSSNVAQTGYLLLGICVVVFLARSPSAGPEIIGLAVGLTTLLSFWRYGHQQVGLPFPERLFDNSPFYKFIETAPGGEKRFRGILSEPSALAGSSLVTICYMVARAVRVRGRRRWGALAVAAIAAYLGVISTSTTFVVAGVVVAAIAASAFGIGFLMRRTSVSALVGIVACALAIVALWVIPIIAEFVSVAVDEKVGSDSFDERSAANSASYDTFLDTFGLGVGLGANRASSFFAGLLSTTGLVGTLLLAAALAELISRSASMHRYRPVIWALVASIVLKVIAGPDLSDASGVFWMSLGLLSQAALGTPAGPRSAHDYLATVGPVTGPGGRAGSRWSRWRLDVSGRRRPRRGAEP